MQLHWHPCSSGLSEKLQLGLGARHSSLAKLQVALSRADARPVTRLSIFWHLAEQLGLVALDPAQE